MVSTDVGFPRLPGRFTHRRFQLRPTCPFLPFLLPYNTAALREVSFSLPNSGGSGPPFFHARIVLCLLFRSASRHSCPLFFVVVLPDYLYFILRSCLPSFLYHFLPPAHTSHYAPFSFACPVFQSSFTPDLPLLSPSLSQQSFFFASLSLFPRIPFKRHFYYFSWAPLSASPFPPAHSHPSQWKNDRPWAFSVLRFYIPQLLSTLVSRPMFTRYSVP